MNCPCCDYKLNPDRTCDNCNDETCGMAHDECGGVVDDGWCLKCGEAVDA